MKGRDAKIVVMEGVEGEIERNERDGWVMSDGKGEGEMEKNERDGNGP